MIANRKTVSAHRLNPYLSLGLQRNPFVLEDSGGIARSLWIDRGYSVPPMPKAKQLVQIIGVKGAGKTSHLKRWQAQTGGPYCYYPPDLRGRLKLPAVGSIAYWDEADRIPWPYLLGALLVAVRDRNTIVAGTHVDLRWAAATVGLPIKTIRIQVFDKGLLQQWVHRRIEAVRLPGTICRLQLENTTAKEIATAANGSWREAADLLHIWAARQASESA